MLNAPPVPAAVLSVAGSDLDPLAAAVAACKRDVVVKSVSDDATRHGAFLVDAFKEQQDLARARADLAQRRYKLRFPVAGEKTDDNERPLGALEQSLDARQHALDDLRTLDRLKQDAIGWFRQSYLTQCQGRGA